MSSRSESRDVQSAPSFSPGDKIWARTVLPKNTFRVGPDVPCRYLGYDAETGAMQYELLDGRWQSIKFSQETVKARDTEDE